jgi:hypothetical protein
VLETLLLLLRIIHMMIFAPPDASPLQFNLDFYTAQLETPIHPVYGGICRSADSPSSNTQLPIQSTGICRHCGCSSDSCLSRFGDRCEWTDSTQSCCTSEVCLRKEKPATVILFQPKKPTRLLRTFCGCAVCSGRARGHCRRRFA